MILPEGARADSLRYFVAGNGGLIVRLFTSNTTPADTDEASTYTEASWPGYAPITLDVEAWTIENSTASYGKLTWKALGQQVAINYGWYATRIDGGRIAMVDRFAKPFKVENRGDTVSVSIQLEQRSDAGKWFMSADGQVGIVANFAPGGKASFHRVGAEGLTERIELVSAESLEPATWADIPEARRPAREQAAKLGYR